MRNKILNMLGRRRSNSPAAAVPGGQRVYAIGDVHGRLDLFETLIEAIERDDAGSSPAMTTMVLLGDLVDRGLESAGVIARAREWQRGRNVRILTGNHEEMFLRSFEDIDVLRHFLRFGGRETVLSYGIDKPRFARAELEEVQQILHEVVPQEDIEFLRSFEDIIMIGGYLFVHAGIQPDTPVDKQEPRELRWIREPFLSHTQPHEQVVVHGHTISEEPEDRGNRIGIDTGAFRSGKLTALVLEGTSRRYLQAIEQDGVVSAISRKIAA